jgi:hypothetical protein
MLGTGIQNTLSSVQLVSNPVSNSMNFINQNAGAVQFFLFNELGQLIEANEYSGNFSVDVSNRAAGIYFAELKSADKKYRVKVVKQ